MAAELEPIVHQWYQRLDTNREFTVIAVDDINALVEIQFFDGELDEVGLEAWFELALEPAEPPEDWTGPMVDFENDDLGYSVEEERSASWPESDDFLSVVDAREVGLGGWEDEQGESRTG